VKVDYSDLESNEEQMPHDKLLCKRCSQVEISCTWT